jgi:hypothetical protein
VSPPTTGTSVAPGTAVIPPTAVTTTSPPVETGALTTSVTTSPSGTTAAPVGSSMTVPVAFPVTSPSAEVLGSTAIAPVSGVGVGVAVPAVGASLVPGAALAPSTAGAPNLAAAPSTASGPPSTPPTQAVAPSTTGQPLTPEVSILPSMAARPPAGSAREAEAVPSTAARTSQLPRLPNAGSGGLLNGTSGPGRLPRIGSQALQPAFSIGGTGMLVLACWALATMVVTALPSAASRLFGFWRKS